MKQIAALGSGIFLLFVLVGGLWVGLVRVIPAGIPRTIFLIAFAVLVAGIFVWLLVSRVRALLAGTRHLVRHVVAAALDLVLLLVSFAAVYQKIGIIDNTQPDSPVIHSFTASLYYSVVTFTTLGYGDFYPVGPGRVLAGIQALTGYLILGLLASTTASVLAPDSKAGWAENQGEEKRED